MAFVDRASAHFGVVIRDFLTNNRIRVPPFFYE